eukprot:CAMPEP_0119375354 /NCGR_PEP_ID=MMETSP1334-20130426/35322_1 /TAXON_ID=127549 /ORGANISM="Calcidiscus leptoporus, Strain RCC1130" /LENGTH=303 /DNA_ID=CAMNT_0007393643 /DNA_START=76 /DNA_END=987 /DNA_ORIENTATION=-
MAYERSSQLPAPASREDPLRITHERISLTCPVTRQRLQQPCRSSACALHAQPFCAHALPYIRVLGCGKSDLSDSGLASRVDSPAATVHYRCPCCDAVFSEGELEHDVQLLLFLAEHIGLTHAAVSKSTSGRQWRYRRVAKPSTQPSRARSRAVLHIPKAKSSVRSDQSGRATSPSGSSEEPRVKPEPSSEIDVGSCWAQPAAATASAASVHSSRVRLLNRLMDSRHSRREGARVEDEHHSGSNGGGRGARALAHPLPTAEKAARRRDRREQQQRRQTLCKMKEILIKRALYESHPESTGDCLW